MNRSKTGRKPKLSAVRIAHILHWHQTQKTLTEVARENGVSRSTIQSVIRNHGWFKAAPANDLIHPLLVAVTTHVTELERDILDLHGYARGEYGWLIWVGTSKEFPVPEVESPSEGLTGAIAYARTLHCTYLLLDRNAAPLPDVPTYDW